VPLRGSEQTSRAAAAAAPAAAVASNQGGLTNGEICRRLYTKKSLSISVAIVAALSLVYLVGRHLRAHTGATPVRQAVTWMLLLTDILLIMFTLGVFVTVWECAKHIDEAEQLVEAKLEEAMKHLVHYRRKMDSYYYIVVKQGMVLCCAPILSCCCKCDARSLPCVNLPGFYCCVHEKWSALDFDQDIELLMKFDTMLQEDVRAFVANAKQELRVVFPVFMALPAFLMLWTTVNFVDVLAS